MGRYSLRDGKISAEKLSVSGKVPMQYVIPKGLATSTTSILEAWDVTATAAKDNTDLLIQPPFPVQLSVQAVEAGTAGNTDAVTVKGLNAYGELISEYIIVSSTANGINYSENAYAKINSIQPKDAVALKSTDVNVGHRQTYIGLPYPIESTSDIIGVAVNGAYATTYVSGTTLKVEDNNVLKIPNIAANSFSIIYKTELQE